MAPVDRRVGAGHMARRAGLAHGAPGKPGTGCQELAGQGCEPAIDKKTGAGAAGRENAMHAGPQL